MSSAEKYVFTPCCSNLPVLEFSAAGVVYPGYDPLTPKVWYYNGDCYTITSELVPLGVVAGLDPAPPYPNVLPAGEDCVAAQAEYKDCVCEQICYILYECADTVNEAALRFATDTDLALYVGGTVKIDEYPDRCFFVQERSDAEIDSSLCLNSITVTVAAVQDCNCTCKCFSVRSKNSIIYTDCNGNLIRGVVPPATGLQICSITYPISDNNDIIVVEEKGACVGGICPSECYILEDCEGIKDPIYTTSQSILPYVVAGQIVEIAGYDGCWIPSPSEVCDCAVDVTVVRYHDDCIACKGFDAYKLTNCDNDSQIIYTTDNLSAYVGKTVELVECTGCWYVEKINVEPPTDTTTTVNYVYDDCEECKRIYWHLEDCSDSQNILITYTDLSAYEGQVINLDYCPNICWIVSSTRLSTNAQPVVLEGNYTDCSECFLAVNPPLCRSVLPTKGGLISYVDTVGELVEIAVTAGIRTPKLCVRAWGTGSFEDEIIFGECINGECPKVEYKTRSVQPGYDTPACRPEYYEKVVCNFSEAVYKEVLEKRYGISNCCPQDFDKWEIKKEMLYLEALKDPDYLCSTSAGVCNTMGYVQPNCELTDPFGLYTFSRAPQQGDPELIITYRNQEGETITLIVPACLDGNCTSVEYTFCAEYGSIRINGVLTYANNETCPTETCTQSSDLTYIEPCEPL